MKPFGPEDRARRRLARLQSFRKISDAFATSTALPGNAPVVDRKRLPQEAIRLVSDFLATLVWPMMPQLVYKGVRTAARDEDTPVEDADAQVLIAAKITTVSGVRREVEVPVVVRNGKLLEPSVMMVDGVPRIIAQSLVDELTRGGTFRQSVDPRGNIYGPPMDREAHERYLEQGDEFKVRDRVSRGMYTVASRQAQTDLQALVGQTFQQGGETYTITEVYEDQRGKPRCRAVSSSGQEGTLDATQAQALIRGDTSHVPKNIGASKTAQIDPESQNILQQLVDLGPWAQSSPGATIEPEQLQPLLQAGLVEQQGETVTITDAGRAALQGKTAQSGLSCQFCGEPIMSQAKKVQVGGGEFVWADEECAARAKSDPSYRPNVAPDLYGFGPTAQSYEPQQPCDCPAQPLHDVREHCEQCGAFGGCDCAAWDYENPDAVREGQVDEANWGGTASRRAETSCLNCGHAQEMHFTDGRCREWTQGHACGCDHFSPGSDSEARQPGEPSRWNEEHYPERTSRRAQKYDPGARVKVDGKPARVVEQVHEPSESASWDGTYRVEWQNGETDVVPESKLSYDEERQTLRHVEAQVDESDDSRVGGTCSCSQPNCSHGGSGSRRGKSCLNDAEGQRGLCYDCESFDYQRPTKESQQDPTTEFDQGGGHRVCPRCKSTNVNTEWIDDNTSALTCLDCGTQVPTRVAQNATCEACGAPGAKPTTDIDGTVGEPNLCDDCDARYSPKPRQAHHITCTSCDTAFISGDPCPGCGSRGESDLSGYENTRPTMPTPMHGRKGQVLGKDQLPVCDDCDKPATRHVGGYWLCDEHAAQREQRASLPGIGLGARVLQAGRAGQVVDVQFDGTIGGQLALVAWHDGGEDYFTVEDFRSGRVAVDRAAQGKSPLERYQNQLPAVGDTVQVPNGSGTVTSIDWTRTDNPDAPPYVRVRTEQGAEESFPLEVVQARSVTKSGRAAAHDEDGQPAQHNEERRQDDFSAGDTVAFATSFRNRTRGGPSYLIDSGTSAEVVRDVFEDGTRFEVRLSDGQLAIVPRETLRSARRTAQVGEGEVLQIKRESDVPCDACGSTSFVPTASGLACASCSTPFATAEAPAAAAPVAPAAPATVQQRAVVAQQDYPSWCGYCGEDAGGRAEQVDLPSGRKISLCSRHNRQSLDRYHDGGSAQFIQSVDKMPDSFWQKEGRRTASTPRVDQVLREVQGLKDDGYSDLDVMLSVFDRFPTVAESVMQAAKEKGILDL